MARERPHIRLGDRRAPEPAQGDGPSLQGAAQAGRAAAHPLSRPPAHVRHTSADPQRKPKDRFRDVGPRHNSDNPGYLFPRPAQHAGSGCCGDGGRPLVAYCCPTAAKALGATFGGSSVSGNKPLFLQKFYLVGAVGLEPTRPCGLRILSPVRLPIPPRPRAFYSSKCR